MEVMAIVKSKTSRNYLPLHDWDVPVFRHFCEGMIEVRDIEHYAPIFKSHGWTFVIQDEAATMDAVSGKEGER